MVYIKDITKSEMDALLVILKSPEIDYNANSLAKAIHLTPMGALKILKRLEKDEVLISKKIGRTSIYRINTKSDYTKNYLSLILAREAKHALPSIKRWLTEAKKIKNAEIIILYGSVLEKQEPNDIDLLIVTTKKKFPILQKEIENLNKLSIKKIHPLYQTFEDLIDNIKKRHKPILNAIKGIIVYGERKFIEIYNESRKE